MFPWNIGKSIGNHRFSQKFWMFFCKICPLNQSIDRILGKSATFLAHPTAIVSPNFRTQDPKKNGRVVWPVDLSWVIHWYCEFNHEDPSISIYQYINISIYQYINHEYIELKAEFQPCSTIHRKITTCRFAWWNCHEFTTVPTDLL